MAEQKTRRRVKPLRLTVMILIFIAAGYLVLCAAKAGADIVGIVAQKLKKEPEEERMIPTMSLYDGKTAEGVKLDGAKEDQSLMLINTEHLLPEGFSADVSEYRETGVWFNNCMHEAYGALSDDVKDKFGEKLFVSSAYRTEEEQKKQIEEEGDTAQAVGASEHQAGLAADVYIMNFAGEGFIKSDVGKWINSDCWQYGFIIRYPKGKTRVTGIEFEPWHLRYVGSPHAEYIMQNGLCYEEYIDSLETGVLYKISTADGDYAVIRYYGDPPKIPEKYEDVTTSPDNTGAKIATFRIK